MGSSQKTSIDRGNDFLNEEHPSVANENTGNSEKQNGVPRLESKPEGDESGFMSKSKRKRNRRKERKKNKVNQRSLKVIGVNAAGLMRKLESFEKLLEDENPSVFCIQETKLKKANQIKTD